MKRNVLMTIFLMVFALGCAPRLKDVEIPKAPIVARNITGADFSKKCPDCFMGCAANVTKTFVRYTAYKAMEYCDENNIDLGYCYDKFFYDAVYTNDEGQFIYIEWLSIKDETPGLEEFTLSVSWVLENTCSKPKRCQDIKVKNLNKLEPVAKVLARAIVEELTVKDIWDELTNAMDAVNLAKCESEE